MLTDPDLELCKSFWSDLVIMFNIIHGLFTEGDREIPEAVLIVDDFYHSGM